MDYETDSRFALELAGAEITNKDLELLDVLSDANEYVGMVTGTFNDLGLPITPQDQLVYRAPDDMEGNQRLLMTSLAISESRTSLTIQKVIKSPYEDLPYKNIGQADYFFGFLNFSNPESLRNSVGVVSYRDAVKVNGVYLFTDNTEKALYGWRAGKKIAVGVTGGIDPVAQGHKLFGGLSISKPDKFFHYRSGQLIDIAA